MELSSAIRRAIRRDEPVVVDGITLYPIRVAEYEEFLTARPAIEVMQRTFPVRLLSVPLLQALYTMDLEAVEDCFTGHCCFLPWPFGLGWGRKRTRG